MSRNRGGYKFLGGWRGLRELLPNNSEAFTQIFASLKSYNFRLYFGGQCISLIGTWMQQIAMSWLVFRLTGSVFLLATVTFMAQIPILVVTPCMSVFVDRFNRRNLLILTQSLSMLQALLLAVLTLTGLIQVWHIMVLSLLIGLVNALDNPTRQSFYPSLVPKDKLKQRDCLEFCRDQRFPSDRACRGRSVDRYVRGRYLFPAERHQLQCRDCRLADDAAGSRTGKCGEAESVGGYAGWIPVRGGEHADPDITAFNECHQLFRLAPDDVYSGLREDDLARGE